MRRIDTDATRELERLANLALDDDERARVTADLDRIVDLLDAIARVDVTAIAPWSPPTVEGGASALRPDVVGPVLARDEITAGAPAVHEGLVVVPRFVES